MFCIIKNLARLKTESWVESRLSPGSAPEGGKEDRADTAQLAGKPRCPYRVPGGIVGRARSLEQGSNPVT
jgi:hypothetical protein